MATFKDTAGDEWAVRLTAAALGRLRTDAGVSLVAATFAEQVGKLYDEEPDRFGRCLWVLCRKQAEAGGLAEDDFADRLDGPTVQAALSAVFDALADFYLSPAAATAMKARVAATTAELTASVLARLNSSATTPPGSVASGPAG